MFALTMKKVTLGTLIFFIFVSQHIFGKVTVLRGSPKDKDAEMICITEDDGSALVWNAIDCDGQTYSKINNEVIEMELDYDSNNKSNVNNHNKLNCKMNETKGCLNFWTKDNWDLTNSLITPMGPVFDQRWEEFREYKNIEGIFAHVNFSLPPEVKLSFSVRASHDVHLVISRGNHYSENLCYWILIGSQNNTHSVIKKCQKGVPLFEKWPEVYPDCEQVASYKHAPLSESEWRTFVITWDSVKRKISVYDTDGNNLTYTDEEKLLNSRKYYVYLGSDSKMLFRIHLYNFLYTTVENASLISPVFKLNGGTECVQLLIGLCAECDAQVMLLDASANEVLKEKIAWGSFKVAIHGLPMWQSIKIDTYSINHSDWAKVQLIPKLNKSSSNPLWAIANVRYFHCPQNEILKKNNITYSQCEKDQKCFWPNTTCQKLFYNEHAIVSPISPVKLDVNLDEVKCQIGMIGPQCLFSCQDNLKSKKVCQGVKICHVDGYTCASYFSGDSCSERCKLNTYGPNCKKCGSCLHKTPKEQCDKVTGVCSNGCNNTTEMVYVPPLCQTSVDNPNGLTISTTETTIQVIVPITWKDEYEEMSICYSFAIKKNGTYNDEPTSWSKLFQNMTQLIRNFEKLEPATNYQIRCSLLIADVPIHSDWKVAVTKSLGKHYLEWLIPISLLFFVTTITSYWFYSRKQKQIAHRKKNEALPADTKIGDVQMTPVVLEYHEAQSNPSNGHSLPQINSPGTSNTITHEGDKMQSLVKVKDLENYVKKAVRTGLLNEQYKLFRKGQVRTRDIHSDYINANYITVCGTERRYIPTQGPKSNTIDDFWRMVWQENVLVICMLANVVENGKTICEQYWPDIGKKKKYGDILVLNAKHNIFADYCFRTFRVTCGDETRKIEHLHYTAWPDHGVPSYTHSIVTYLKKLLATSSEDGPIVVHCSAGTGRTGTIILCDICLNRAATKESISVFAEMTSIATKSLNLMVNKQQYLLAHLVLVECLFSNRTALSCNHKSFLSELGKRLPIQQQRLQDVAWQDKALRQGSSSLPLSKRNRANNRFPQLMSDSINRIYLKKYPASDEDSDYISSVYVDGVKLRNQYVATQLPMLSTKNDFWRMVAEFKVGLILMLQPPDLQDPTCCAIAPESGKFKPTPYLNITLKDVVEMESRSGNYTSQKLLLVDNSKKPSRKQSVTILCLTEWKPGKNQPPPPVMTMITFWQAVEKIARGNGPTVTLCHDGVTGCGLYLAMSFLLERMVIEEECDVYLAVRAIRRSWPDFVHPLEHPEYLCEAAKTYLECFKTKANFS